MKMVKTLEDAENLVSKALESKIPAVQRYISRKVSTYVRPIEKDAVSQQ